MHVEYKEKALEQLSALPRDAQKRIVTKITFFASQKTPLQFAKHLVGHSAYRFRVGNYRVIVDIHTDMFTVLLIVKREGAYKDL